MKTEKKLTFPALLQETTHKHPNAYALGYVDEQPLTYSELKKRVDALTVFLEKLGCKKGDKIAILSNNMPNWGVTYYAITSMGAIAVPLLPDFQPLEIEKILEHSESKALFISENLRPKVEGLKLLNDIQMIGIDEFNLINGELTDVNYSLENISDREYNVNEDLAALIYTSGTTGRPKGGANS